MTRGRAVAAIAASACLLSAPLAVACPAFDSAHAPAETVAQPDTPDRPLNVSMQMTVDGDADLSACANLPLDSAGFTTVAGQLSVIITRHDTHDMLIDVVADCDAVLLVNDPAGRWLFDDDGGESTNPALEIARPLEGAHDIWVGSYDGQACPVELLLTLRPRPSA